jgi:hypothetical protein
MRPWPDGRERAEAHGYTESQKEVFAVHWMNGWDWVWMTLMMVFWVVLLGTVVYVAVRLAQHPPRERKS